MSTVDPFTHMEEAWKLETNPFPHGAIRSSADDPFSAEVFPDETNDFYRKLVRGAILGKRSMGFLWSQGVRADTGYGKTTLMQAAARAINDDLGKTVLASSGMKPDRVVPIAATYATINNLNVTGLYAVLFEAVVDAAKPVKDGEALLDKARKKIAEDLPRDSEDDETNPEDIKAALLNTHMAINPAGAPLRPELVNAFALGGANEVLRQLSTVSIAARVRNGLQYLDFLITTLAAADIEHLFIYVDQLEDLATNKSIGSAKRSREIGRIRDLMEIEPYTSRLHFVFTFHNTAAKVLERFWEVNRLPRFEIAPDNTSAVVVLRGLSNDEQVAELLRVYLDDKRLEHVEDSLLPFEPDALSVLRQVSDGRPGILLASAHEILQRAAELGRPRIDGEFAGQYFRGALEAIDGGPSETDAVSSSDIDDILLG